MILDVQEARRSFHEGISSIFAPLLSRSRLQPGFIPICCTASEIAACGRAPGKKQCEAGQQAGEGIGNVLQPNGILRSQSGVMREGVEQRRLVLDFGATVLDFWQDTLDRRIQSSQPREAR